MLQLFATRRYHSYDWLDVHSLEPFEQIRYGLVWISFYYGRR